MPRNEKAITLEIGQKVGEFIVLRKEYVGRNKTWVCRCKCGAEKVFWRASAILRQQTCGCGTDGAGLTAKQRRSMLSRMQGYKNGAKKRGFEWNLSYEEFVAVASGDCAYCGCEPKVWNCVSNAPSIKKDCPNIIPEQYSIKFNGVDRVDSGFGYISGNIAPCCIRCNRAKSDMNLDEFKDHVERMHTWLSRTE